MIDTKALWSYAGVSLREDEGGWADPNRMRMLKQHGFGYVAPLCVDGATKQNEAHLDMIVREAQRNGTAVVGWATPRNTSGIPIEVTVEKLAEMVARYGLQGVRYQCEAEFEYSNPSMGGTPEERFNAMAHLGAAHRRHLGNLPAAVYARVGLNLADAWWAKAWQYQFRCFVECYGPAEGGTHPGWAAVAGPGSYAPQIVGGWFYRVKLGLKFHLGRVADNGREIVVDEHGTFKIGSPAGPRMIEAFGNPKYGAVMGFFPTSWVKPVVPTYAGAIGRKPSGETLSREILTFQTAARKYGDASKGFSVYVGPEMNQDHFDHISPTVLAGAALLP